MTGWKVTPPAEPCVVLRCENYVNTLAPASSEGDRPRSQKEQAQSKLEGADMETLIQKRQAILSEIESTREELEQQKKFRDVLSELIAEVKA